MKRTYFPPIIEIDEVEPSQLMNISVEYSKDSGIGTKNQWGNSTSFDDGEDTTSPIWDD